MEPLVVSLPVYAGSVSFAFFVVRSLVSLGLFAAFIFGFRVMFAGLITGFFAGLVASIAVLRVILLTLIPGFLGGFAASIRGFRAMRSAFRLVRLGGFTVSSRVPFAGFGPVLTGFIDVIHVLPAGSDSVEPAVGSVTPLGVSFAPSRVLRGSPIGDPRGV